MHSPKTPPPHPSPFAPKMLQSRIEPDPPPLAPPLPGSTKVPKALSYDIEAYNWRAQEERPGVRRIRVIDESPFYIKIKWPPSRAFKMKDLLVLAMKERALLLRDILLGVSQIARKYGYFYLLEEMVSYDEEGRANVWLHSDFLVNKRQYPINHGSLSEEIFVSDFKDHFGGNFNQYRSFHKATSIHGLQSFLIQCQKQPQNKQQGGIQRQQSLGMLTSMMPPTSSPHPAPAPAPALHSSSVLTLKRSNSLNAYTHLHSRASNQGEVFNTPDSPGLIRLSGHTSSPSKLKKRPIMEFKSSSLFSKFHRNEGPFSPTHQSITPSLRNTNPLKVSFPSTTGTFMPFSSNGNISLSLSEYPNDRRLTQEVEEEPIAQDRGQTQSVQHPSSMGNTVEGDLEDLFSEEKSQSSEQLEALREQLDVVFRQ